jgi:outer membrane biosynthesis protein TonB
MRVGPIVSTLGHVAVLAWAVVGLPGAEPYPAEPVDAMPVELVEIGEVTALRLGSKTAEDKPVERASTVETDTPEAAPVEDAGSSQTSQDAPPVPEPSEVAALPDAGAPPPPEPEPAEVSEPEPAPQEAEPAPPEPAPTEQPAETPPPPKETSAAPVQASRTPKSKPTPPKKVTQTATANAESKFSSDKISALLDKQQPSGGGTQTPTGQTALGSSKGKTVSKMTQSELDALRGQISRCWNPPVGASDAEGLVVKIRFNLNQDGTVSGTPSVENSGSNPFFRAAADSARRAILRCQPYTMPVEKYDVWDEVVVNFDPREMFGG